jgi:hypothetical protein
MFHAFPDIWCLTFDGRPALLAIMIALGICFQLDAHSVTFSLFVFVCPILSLFSFLFFIQ